MEPMTKTGRMAVYISCFLVLFSVLLTVRAVRGVRQVNQTLQTQKQIQLLMDKSLQLAQQINAEQWAADEENKAIIAELAKPLDQRPADLDKRQTLLKQRIEGIEELLKQQRLNEKIRAMQEQNGTAPRTESPETKAVLEKY